MLSTEEKGPTNPQVNKRVSLANFLTYDDAKAYKDLQASTGDYSKVKVIARPKGNFEVACYVPLEQK